MKVEIITVPERLDVSNVKELKTAVQNASEKGINALILDCSQTEFIDSSGSAAPISGHKTMRSQQGQFLLGAVQGGARTIFDLTRMDLVFTMFDSVEEARASLEQGKTEPATESTPKSESETKTKASEDQRSDAKTPEAPKAETKPVQKEAESKPAKDAKPKKDSPEKNDQQGQEGNA